MRFSDLHDIFEDYAKLTKSSKFEINGICIEQMVKLNGEVGYHFLYNGHLYEVIKDNTFTAEREIFITLYKEVKSLIRKLKIKELLDEQNYN